MLGSCPRRTTTTTTTAQSRLPADRRGILRHTVEADRAAFRSLLAAVPGAEAEPVGDGLALWLWEGAPMNRVVGLGPDGLGEAGIKAAIAFYCPRNAPARIELSPLQPRSDLHRLSGWGFSIESQIHRFARTVPAAAEWPPGVRVEPDAARWAQIATIGFDGLAGADPRVDTTGFTYRILRLMHELPGTVSLLAVVDGRPAATGRVQILGEVAFLTGQATRPEARGRGAQSRILAASLACARDHGARLAVVDAVALGASERNILRAGFELLAIAATVRRPRDVRDALD